MHPINLSISLFTPTTIIIFFFFFSGNVTASSSTNETFSNCNPTFTCGSFHNITYPFTGGERPEYCGLPQFNLSCRNEFPELTIGSLTYRVLQINQTQQTLTLARLDLWNDTCRQKFINSTLDSTCFNFGIDNEALTLSYYCIALWNFSSPYNRFSCNVSDAYYLIGPVPVDPVFHTISCDVSISVPILKTAANSLADYLLSLEEALMRGFNVNYSIPYNDNCSRCLKSGGQCGYDSLSSKFGCFCGDMLCSDQSGSNKKSLAIGIAIGGTGIISVLLGFFVFYIGKQRKNKIVVFWKKETENDQNVEAFIRNYGSLTLKRYSYSDVKKMTKSLKEKLGQGGYGSVYKGKLSDGRLVAVKVLSESKSNGEEFINEVASISRTSHINIVTLLGFCYERTKRALIYEFMPNGSLDHFIYDKRSSNGNRQLEWKTSNQIAIGIARGLEYLHRGCNTRILHFDIKPHNILLDEDFCPKIADFGLAKLCQKKESIISMTGTRGTIGYIAPEVFCRNFGGVSHKSDVYSYGMMVLEMVGGRKNIDPEVSHTSEIYFPHWIYEPLKLGEDLNLCGVMTEEEEEITRKMILVSLWCIQTKPSDRPPMTKVIEMLEGSLQSLQIPPKPYLSSPPRSPQQNSSTTSTLS